MSVANLSRLVAPQMAESIAYLVQTGHGTWSALSYSTKQRNRAAGSYLDFHRQALDAWGYDPAGDRRGRDD